MAMGEGSGKLSTRWLDLCRSAARDAGADVCEGMFKALRAAYEAPDRHYHGIGHIADCLREFDTVRHLAKSAAVVEYAIWFHDLVYDGRRQDNEERSAELAETHLKRLHADEAFRQRVRELILFTRHDREPPDIDGKLMVDIDLASLARPAEVFDENTRLIRQEFPHVNDADFARGRRDMLGRFLARPRIYYTDVFHDRYEKQARANLTRALARW
jgi:predicted metal-dependent HD superfamily phosphohydrolase